MRALIIASLPLTMILWGHVKYGIYLLICREFNKAALNIIDKKCTGFERTLVNDRTMQYFYWKRYTQSYIVLMQPNWYCNQWASGNIFEVNASDRTITSLGYSNWSRMLTSWGGAPRSFWPPRHLYHLCQTHDISCNIWSLRYTGVPIVKSPNPHYSLKIWQ